MRLPRLSPKPAILALPMTSNMSSTPWALDTPSAAETTRLVVALMLEHNRTSMAASLSAIIGQDVLLSRTPLEHVSVI